MDNLSKQIKIEKARRVLSCTFKHYVPTGKGDEFIKLVGEDNNFISGFIAANGIGKTYLGVNILANLIWHKERSKWFDYPLFNSWKYKKKNKNSFRTCFHCWNYYSYT